MGSPQNCRYTATHEWCRVEGGAAVVGITQHAVEQLTDLVYVDLAAPKTRLAAGQPFGEIESVKAVSELSSPVTGEVTARNDAVVNDPAVISADPYGAGWLIKLKMSKPSEVEALMDAAAYDASLAS
jgi:glycine cleavage system H protein